LRPAIDGGRIASDERGGSCEGVATISVPRHRRTPRSTRRRRATTRSAP